MTNPATPMLTRANATQMNYARLNRTSRTRLQVGQRDIQKRAHRSPRRVDASQAGQAISGRMIVLPALTTTAASGTTLPSSARGS